MPEDGRLGADRVSRSFGPVQALSEVSFVARGQTIHALLGENGAGKTTLIRSLSGLDHPDSGSVLVDGSPVRLKGPNDAFAAGIAAVQQELALSPDLTMLENLVLGMEPTRGGRIDWKDAQRRGQELGQSIGAEIPWRRRASEVEVGTRQQLEIVRCLFRGADTLILDEPSAVLAPSQVENLLDLLRRLRDRGNTIVLITHKLEEVLAVADDVTVLRGGRVVHSQSTAGLDRGALSRLVVGDDISQVRTVRASDVGEAVLEVDGVCTSGRQTPVGPVSFAVRSAEILGIAGVAGNGQDELIEALVGLREVNAGRITLRGQEITRDSVAERRQSGIGYISADRRHEGLSITESLVENSVIGRHRNPPVSRGIQFSRSAARKSAQSVLGRFQVRYGSIDDPASSLSGGNQQKVVVGRELATAPTFLVAAQPTRGVDVRGIQDLHRELLKGRDDGLAIVLMSQELDELVALSDRVLVMYHGEVRGIFDPELPGAKQRIGRAMLGTRGEASDGRSAHD